MTNIGYGGIFISIVCVSGSMYSEWPMQIALAIGFLGGLTLVALDLIIKNLEP